MEKEALILISVLLGAIAAYITARVTSKNQLKVAEETTRKELKMQNNHIYNECLKEEVALKREKLENLHVILSKVALENSQTVSFIQSDENMPISIFRERYQENCIRLHTAESIAALYYPKMTERVRDVYSQSNLFWGSQEGVLRTDIQENKNTWGANIKKVIKASQEISTIVNSLKDDIITQGESLNKKIERDIRCAAEAPPV